MIRQEMSSKLIFRLKWLCHFRLFMCIYLLKGNLIPSRLDLRTCLEIVARSWYPLPCVMFTGPASMLAFYSKYKLDHGWNFPGITEFSKPWRDLLYRNRVEFGLLDAQFVGRIFHLEFCLLTCSETLLYAECGSKLYCIAYYQDCLALHVMKVLMKMTSISPYKVISKITIKTKL